MIINVSINDNFFVLDFYLNHNTKFEQYHEHYTQTQKIVAIKRYKSMSAIKSRDVTKMTKMIVLQND